MTATPMSDSEQTYHFSGREGTQKPKHLGCPRPNLALFGRLGWGFFNHF